MSPSFRLLLGVNFLTYTKAHTKSLQGTNVRFYATRVGEWRLAHTTTTTITAKKTSKYHPFQNLLKLLCACGPRRVGLRLRENYYDKDFKVYDDGYNEDDSEAGVIRTKFDCVFGFCEHSSTCLSRQENCGGKKWSLRIKISHHVVM